MRETAMAKMRWYAGCGQHFYSPLGHYYVRLEDGTQIEVHPATYDEQFRSYLERIGVQHITWSEIMRKAEDEWNAYCQVMDDFAEYVQKWHEYKGFGVYIERPKVQAQKGSLAGTKSGSCVTDAEGEAI
jgi:hypothetical protein